MATRFKVGDRVLVDNTNERRHGQEGRIIEIDRGMTDAFGYPVTVEFADDCGDVFEFRSLRKVPKPKTAKQTYRGNGKHQWEVVTTSTERLRVPGGWLYRNWSGVSTMVFVPTPEVTGHVI